MLAQGASLNNATLVLHNGAKSSSGETSTSTLASATTMLASKHNATATTNNSDQMTSGIVNDAAANSENTHIQKKDINNNYNHSNKNLEELGKVINIYQSNPELLALAYAIQQQQQHDGKSQEPLTSFNSLFSLQQLQHLLNSNLATAQSISTTTNTTENSNYEAESKEKDNSTNTNEESCQEEKILIDETNETISSLNKAYRSRNKVKPHHHHHHHHHHHKNSLNKNDKLESNEATNTSINESDSTGAGLVKLNSSANVSRWPNIASCSSSSVSSSSISSSSSSSSGHSSPSHSPKPDQQKMDNAVVIKENKNENDNSTINDTLINNYNKLIDLSKGFNHKKMNSNSFANKTHQISAMASQQALSIPKQNLPMNDMKITDNNNKHIQIGANTPINPKKKQIQHSYHDFHLLSNNIENNVYNVSPTSSNNHTNNVSSVSTVPHNNGVSNEVKLKLKNAILQKLENKNNGNHNHRNHNLEITPTVNNVSNNNNNLTSISMYQLPSTNKNQQLADLSNKNSNSFIVEAINQASNLCSNNSNFNMNINNDESHQKKTPSSSIMNQQELDENNLRRTTSEPNLKVKSALKDRLLEKRNLLNPIFKRPTNIQSKRESPQLSQQQQQQQQELIKQQILMPTNQNKLLIPPSSPAMMNYQHSLSTPLSSSLSSLPSMSASNILAAAAALSQQQRESHLQPHEQPDLSTPSNALLALVAAVTKQQQCNMPNSDICNMPNYNQLTATLHQLALQNKNQNNHHQNIELFESFALAAALANQQQQHKQLQYQQQHHFNNANLGSSFDHRRLQHQYGLMNQNGLINHHLPPYLTPHNLSSNEKMVNSLSFPNLPIPASHYLQHLNRVDDSSKQINVVDDDFDEIEENNNNKNDKLKQQVAPPTLLKFGHIAHVEEENETMLENELKNAAKINELATKSLLSNSHHNQSNKTMASNSITDCQTIEMDDDSSETSQHNKRYKSNHYHQNNNRNRYDYRLERASSHQLYNSNYKAKPVNYNTSIPHFSQQQLPQLQHKENNQFSVNLTEAQQQLLYLQHQEMQEKHLQQKFQTMNNNNKLSFLSDPHLLQSLKIASMSNLNQPAPSTSTSPTTSNNKSLTSKKSIDSSNILRRTPPTNYLIQPTIDQDICMTRERLYRYTTGIAYDKIMLKHECTCQNSSNHLETPDRIKSIWSRFKAKDLDEECEIINCKLANISDLLLCHNEQYSLIFGSDIEMRPKLPKEYLQKYMMSVCMASCNGFSLTEDQDNSWNEEYTPLACRAAIGTTYQLASLVLSGKLKNGFALVRPPGSHAEHNKPLGFCYFNTVAIVAKMLKKNLGLERILIVDWDVHHGNGTQQMLYNDSNILYMSLHRHDNGNFFPGTGSIYECGQDAGLGKNVNIAWNSKLNPPMGDTEYLAAFRSVVMPIARSFKPQIVLVSCGFDGTEDHPKELGGYKLSPMCFAYMTKKLMSLAEGKVVLALEGGYDIQSLCDCSEMCMNALMNKQIPSFSSQTLESMPNIQAVQDLENVIEVQKKHWPNLKDYKQYIKMPHSQFISSYIE